VGRELAKMDVFAAYLRYWENFRVEMKDLEKRMKIIFMFVLHIVIEPRCCCYTGTLEDELMKDACGVK
jgi:hypothetical protein